jgi:membrane associated rhomboid family serine protease
MFIPLKDLNPRRTIPVVNMLLIVANVVVFFYQLTLPPGLEAAMVKTYGAVPARFPSFLVGHTSFEVAFLPLLTSMFLHSGFLHIGFNMLFLWVFGDNVEDFFGHIQYFFFYLVCGVGAGLVHVLFNLSSPLPALGASGAISGVMGAYLILFPRARVLTLVIVFLIPLPAVLILGVWFLMQFLDGIHSLGMASTGGVAIWAHIGGFILGMLIANSARRRQVRPAE